MKGVNQGRKWSKLIREENESRKTEWKMKGGNQGGNESRNKANSWPRSAFHGLCICNERFE